MDGQRGGAQIHHSGATGLSAEALRIRFVVETGQAAGMGHLMRCCSVAAELRRLVSCSCHFAAPAYEHARSFLAATGDAGCIAPAEAGEPYAITVIDVSDPATVDEDTLRSASQLLAWIEDEPRAHGASDVVFQPNVLDVPGTGSEAAFYSGAEFLILHPAYKSGRIARLRRHVKRVLLCFGGSDPENLSARIVRLLPELEFTGEYRLALGPCYPAGEFERISATRPRNLTLLRDLAPLAHEMSACDMAILSGGTLLYEACASGRPAIIISQNESQAREASVFGARNAVIHLGQSDSVADSEILRAARRLLGNSDERKRLGKFAAALVPRDGAGHVAERLMYHYNSL